MNLPRVAGTSLLCIAPLLLTAAQPAPKVVAFNASVRVEVDAAGKPVRVEAPQDLPQAVRAYIEKRVASWQYEPARQDGIPVPAMTFVSVGACAIPTPAGDGFSLGVDFKGNGPRIISKNDRLPPPSYPVEAQRQAISGSYLVSYSIQPDGSTQLGDIEVLEGSKHFVREFRATLAEWAGNLRYEPERVNGLPVATRMSFPVQFIIDNSHRNETRQQYKARREAELQAAAMTKSECQLAGSAAAQGLRPVAMDSPIKVTPTPAG